MPETHEGSIYRNHGDGNLGRPNSSKVTQRVPRIEIQARVPVSGWVAHAIIADLRKALQLDRPTSWSTFGWL